MCVYLAPCRHRMDRPDFWTVRMDRSIPLDLTIIARLQPGNSEMLDYLLLPDFEPLTERLYLKRESRKTRNLLLRGVGRVAKALQASGFLEGGYQVT